MEDKKYELIKFKDGDFSLDVNVSPTENTVWLTQKQMALLFDVSVDSISLHIKNIFKESELNCSTVEESSVVQTEGSRIIKRITKIYNLDMIISVGYRIKSKRGILFRRWANEVLKQYLLNGFAINEKRIMAYQSNILQLEENIIDIKNRLNILENKANIESEKVLYEGEILEAYTFIRKLFFLARKSLIIVDYYADSFLLSMLSDIKVNIEIIT